MLSISFVGTRAFISGALEAAPPANLRVHRIDRCPNLMDARWNGRYAWAAGQWLYQHGSAIPISRKSERFIEYGERLSTEPPEWMTTQQRRKRALDLLSAGSQPMRVAEVTGESFQAVYRWRAISQQPQTPPCRKSEPAGQATGGTGHLDNS